MNIFLSAHLKKLILEFKGIVSILNYLLLKIIVSIFNTRTIYEKTIAIINSEQIGDIILTIDFLNSVSNNNFYKNKLAIIQDKYQDVFNSININFKLITYNKQNFRYNIIYKIKIILALRKYNIDVILNISPVRGNLNDEITLLSGSKSKIATNFSSVFKSRLSLCYYNKKYSYILTDNFQSEYLKLTLLLDRLNITYTKSKRPFKVNTICNLTLLGTSNYVVIAPATTNNIKNWDKSSFLMLANKFSESMQIVYIGTKNQNNIINYLNKNTNNSIAFINELSFPDLINLIAGSKLFIGLDSGLTHVALYLEIPLVAIIGGGGFGKFFPYREYNNAKFLYHQLQCFGCNWHCIYGSPNCINLVSVESAFQACKSVIM